MNDARTRLRKMVSGYKLLRKAKAGTEIYDATIKQTGANEYTFEVTDKAKTVVSTGKAKSLELARRAVRGNLIALGCNIPMSKKSEAVPVTPPIIIPTLNLGINSNGNSAGGTPNQMTATLVDQDMNGIEGVLITAVLDSAAIAAGVAAYPFPPTGETGAYGIVTFAVTAVNPGEFTVYVQATVNGDVITSTTENITFI